MGDNFIHGGRTDPPSTSCTYFPILDRTLFISLIYWPCIETTESPILWKRVVASKD